MKKITLLALGVCLLLLTGCGSPEALETTGAQVTEPQIHTEPQVTTQEPETTAAADVPGETRPERMEMTLIFEGTEVSVPMTLWQRPAYSLYFTEDDGWYMEYLEDQGLQVDRYSTTRNPLIQFSVVYLGAGEELEAYDYLRAAYPELNVSSWDIGTWTGTNMEAMEMLEARYNPGDGNSYLLVAKYPLEAAEGFGVSISGMMTTFEITE